jgi:hypothetical protein
MNLKLISMTAVLIFLSQVVFGQIRSVEAPLPANLTSSELEQLFQTSNSLSLEEIIGKWKLTMINQLYSKSLEGDFEENQYGKNKYRQIGLEGSLPDYQINDWPIVSIKTFGSELWFVSTKSFSETRKLGVKISKNQITSQGPYSAEIFEGSAFFSQFPYKMHVEVVKLYTFLSSYFLKSFYPDHIITDSYFYFTQCRLNPESKNRLICRVAQVSNGPILAAQIVEYLGYDRE